MSSIDSTKTFKKLHDCFAKYGFSYLIISDNRSQVVNDEFETFCYNMLYNVRKKSSLSLITNGASFKCLNQIRIFTLTLIIGIAKK